jgi:hypothetical protein
MKIRIAGTEKEVVAEKVDTEIKVEKIEEVKTIDNKVLVQQAKAVTFADAKIALDKEWTNNDKIV